MWDFTLQLAPFCRQESHGPAILLTRFRFRSLGFREGLRVLSLSGFLGACACVDVET